MCGLLAYVGQKIDRKTLVEASEKLIHRGPDSQQYKNVLPNTHFVFLRLAIMDLSSRGMQPFQSADPQLSLMCNGEIYNHRELRTIFSAWDYTSSSDCEPLLPLFHSWARSQHTSVETSIRDTLLKLDGEFAGVFAFDDAGEERLIAFRDPLGIRPLFYGTNEQGSEFAFASEAKALQDLFDHVQPVEPGTYFDSKTGEFDRFCKASRSAPIPIETEKVAKAKIRDLLTSAVEKRICPDAPMGFLLSGGLDSSLVCAIAARKLNRPIKTFAIGTHTDAIDLRWAKQVAEHIGSDHTEILFTPEQAIESIRQVIYHLETWDITTIRASLGMFYICKEIRRLTDIKVLLTGEVSDEMFGYKYTDFAPSASAFQKEAEKRVDELYLFDVLRADRCLSAHSFEARVPFSDRAFVDHVMSISGELKMNKNGVGKRLLREAFAEDELLPKDVLMREKAAFSDAVGHSMVDEVKRYAESVYDEQTFKTKKASIKHLEIPSKEALLYYEIFIDLYPGRTALIKEYWLPNQEWKNCNVKDPSARELPNYGESGT